MFRKAIRKMQTALPINITASEFLDAARSGDIDRAKLYLRKNFSNLNKALLVTDKNGRNVIQIATLYNQKEILRLIFAVSPRLKINTFTHLNNCYSLIEAAEKGDAELVEILLKFSSADVNVVNNRGIHPYLAANSRGSREIIAMLDAHVAKHLDAAPRVPIPAAAAAPIARYEDDTSSGDSLNSDISDEDVKPSICHNSRNMLLKKHSTAALIHTAEFQNRRMHLRHVEPQPLLFRKPQKQIGVFQRILDKRNYKGEIPEDLIDPVTFCIIDFPIKVSSGNIYDRESLRNYFIKEKAYTIPCPITRIPINLDELNQAADVETMNKIRNFMSSVLYTGPKGTIRYFDKNHNEQKKEDWLRNVTPKFR